MTPFPDAFTTRRLTAERLTAAHRPAVQRLHGDPAVMALLGGPRDADQTAAYLARNLRHWDEYGFGVWLLRETHAPDVAGLAVLRHVLVDGVDEVEVGYAFHPPYWGRGLATEVARACVALGRERLGLTTIVALTHRDNHRSQRVLQKAGLAFEREIVHEGLPTALFRTPPLPPGDGASPPPAE